MNYKIRGLQLLIAGLFILLFPACKTNEFFSIDVMEPAELNFSPGVKRVLIAHNSHLANKDSTGTRYQIYDQVVYDTLYVDTLLGRYAINSLSDRLNYIGRFEAVPVDSSGWVFPSHPDLYNQSDINHIRNLCEENQADAMIILNNMDKNVNYDLYYSGYGGYYGDFIVFLTTRWLFINPFNSKLLDKKMIIDTLSFPSSELLFEFGFETEYIRHEYLMESLNQAAVLYAERISPHYVSTLRMVFTRGNKFLKKGYEEASAGNWKSASNVWEKALEDREPKNLSRACFNLALANEMEGLLSEALEWAQESYRLFPDTLNQTYINILQERLKLQDEIFIQMEGDQ